MSRSMIIFALLVVASPSPAPAVDTLRVTSPDPILEGWRWTEFNRSSGLAGQVRNIVEDRDGNVWFATNRGAQHYNGVRWTTYTKADGLASDNVWAILQARDGAMWFGTIGGGISRFDGETWTTYTAADGLATNSILWNGLLQARDGTLWAGFWTSFADTSGTQAGISRFDGETWTTVEVPVGPPRPRILDIHQAFDGAIWFTTFGHGVLRFDGTGWTRYTAEDGLAGNGVREILESRDGSLWVGFGNGVEGISRFDGRGWRTYTARDGLPEGVNFNSLWQTQDGTVWAGSGRGGVLCRFDGERWKPYAPEEIPQVSRNVFGEPMHDGTVWIYDWRGDKAFRFDPVSTQWTVYPGVQGRMYPIGNELWIGTEEGAVRFDGKTWLRYTGADGLIDGPVNVILKAGDGSLWVAGQHRGKSGAARFDGRTWRVFTEADGLVGQRIHNGFVADTGDIWFGTNYGTWREDQSAGALRFDGETWTVYSTENGLAHNRTYDSAQTPDGAIWVATRVGLSRFDGESWTHFQPGDEEQTTRRPSRLFVTPDGALWTAFGTDTRGVVRYDGQTWQRFTAADGLGSDEVWGIHRSRDGTLWFGTSAGLTRYDGKTWHTYSREDMPTPFGYYVSQSISEFPDGALWLRGASDLVRFVPDKHPPETVLEPATERVSSAGNILLRWSGRDLWDGTLPRDLRYQWRMDGAEWSPWSKRADFTFTALSSGKHTFEVRAVDRDMSIDPTPAVHAFVVEAPWWRNPWILGPMLVLLVLVGVQTVRVVGRDRRLREANRDLQQKTADLEEANVRLQELDTLKTDFFSNVSHELRTPMTAIKGYIDNMLDGIAGAVNEKQERYLTRVKSNADRLTRHINDLLDLSRIDRGHTELLQLHIEKLSIREVISEAVESLRPVAESAGLKLEFEGADATVLADRDRLVQILTNLMGNAVKFTPAGGQISVTVELDGNGDVQTRVRDTGKGIPAEDLEKIFDRFYQVKGEGGLRPGTGLGLPITKELVELQGGEIRAESEVGVGSAFIFILPEAGKEKDR